MRDDDPLKYFPGYAEACAKAEANNLVPERRTERQPPSMTTAPTTPDCNKTVNAAGIRCSALFGAWVDVNERRPETMCHVLCATDSGYVDVSFYDPTAKLDELKLGRKYCGKWGRYFELCKRGYKITHWMPLPKAPNND